VINIIAWVSLIAVAVPTAAVIILLAMFEGLTGIINELDTTLDGDIEIVAQRGQTFDEDALDLALLSDIDGVESITSYIEQSVMASATGRRIPITIRGVEPSYYDVIPANKLLVRGNATSIFDQENDKIVLFYTTLNNEELDIINLVKDKIPVYMFPEVIKHLKVMPYNMNGKIDRIELKRMYEAQQN
jgi:ABC-type lipoprotein release transport system permease subunit